MNFDTCDHERILKAEERLQYLEERVTDPTLTEKEQRQAMLLTEMIRWGSYCPPTPKVKLQAAVSLFGLIFFIIASYNVLRNICYMRVE